MFASAKTKTRSYDLTTDDILWLARSLWGECGPKADDKAYFAVAHCMLQRYLRWDGNWAKWPNWAAFIRAFSQPVNPKWSRPSSWLSRKFPKLCNRIRVKRRRTISECSWAKLPRPAKRAAMLFAIGESDNPVPTAINFGSRGLIKRQGRKGITIGGNTFIDKDGMSWQPGPVTIEL